MRAYQPNAALAISLNVTPPTLGAVIQSVSYTVYDEANAVVQVAQAGVVVDAALGAISLDTMIPANTVDAGKTEIRRIGISITYVGGAVANSDYYYILRDGDGLQVGVNSFVTYTEAELFAFQIPGLNGWSSTEDRDQRIANLMQAREDLCRLTYRYSPDDDQTRIVHTPGLFTIDLKDYDAAELATLSAGFQQALKRAQVIQADYLMAGSTTERQREDGLMSRTVGESSEMYRPGMGPIKYPVCKAAMAALSGYLEMNRWIIGRG